MTVDVNSVQTNIVHLICDNIRVNPDQLCARLNKVSAIVFIFIWFSNVISYNSMTALSKNLNVTSLTSSSRTVQMISSQTKTRISAHKF